MTRRGVTLAGTYLLLWMASQMVRCARSPEGPLPEGGRRRPVPEFRREEPTGETVKIAYRDLNGADPDRPVLVLLHGSPLASASFDGLIAELGDRWRLIVPDLPGFGGSTLRVADYSSRAHALQVTALLDQLKVGKAHLLGYSLGGGVALEMAAKDENRWESLTLISSIGAQELALLGDYTLNRALHGLQLGGLWLIQEGLPHFGWMDRAMVNVAYARNFFDTDQRPYRGWLKTLNLPTFIVHGRDDFLVPYATAREHHRLVPQSELQSIDEAGHMVLISEPEVIALKVERFLEDVASGRAATRSEAEPARVASASEPYSDHRSPDEILGGSIFLMILLALATLISEDLACIGAGILVSKGVMGFVPAAGACFLGIFAGDLLLYLAGLWIGRPALRRAPLKWVLSPGRVEASARFFERQGALIVFSSRFLPGTRLPTYFGAGMFRAPFKQFACWFAVACLVWTPLLVALSWKVGGPALAWLEAIGDYALVAVVGAVLLLWVIIKVLMPMFSFRGRRLWLGKWRRLTRWEFWPMPVFYFPVVCYVLYLGLRHRCFTLFTAANPGMPFGGVVLESKRKILDQFNGHSAIARYIALEAGAGHDASLEAAMSSAGLGLPVVMKPDVGERGAGVKVVRTWADANAYRDAVRETILVQEYVSRHEFGVFYVRRPGEDEGHVFSITDKRLIAVCGDGQHTLEELVLGDDRAVCMARFFLDQLGAEMACVPASGERVPLTEVGTHCRGALFLDGCRHGTEALRRFMDGLSHRFNGFYFGRYDVRVPSVEDLMRGENVKVLELNGVTSEATHIYDPRNSLVSAYKTLFCQWRLAFEIGAGNARNGAAVAGVLDLLSLYLRYKEKQHHEAR